VCIEKYTPHKIHPRNVSRNPVIKRDIFGMAKRRRSTIDVVRLKDITAHAVESLRGDPYKMLMGEIVNFGKSPRPPLHRNRSFGDCQPIVQIAQRRFSSGTIPLERSLKKLDIRDSNSDSKHSKIVKESKSKSGSTSCSDDDGHCEGEVGDNITDELLIVKELGQGTFGKVFKCQITDPNAKRKSKRKYYVAVKVIRNIPKYVDEAKMEAGVLERIQNEDDKCSRIVNLHDHFSWHDHYCLVFEPLAMSLHDYLETNISKISLKKLRVITRDIILALSFLHGSCNIVHTDIKLENILFEFKDNIDSKTGKSSYRVKLIDFGGAVEMNSGKYQYETINTRQYRSPEVILNIGWSYPSDIWSVGCVLYELLFGKLLFSTHDSMEHLAMIERTCGAIPSRLIRKSPKNYFDSDKTLRWPTNKRYSSSRISAVKRMILLQSQMEGYIENLAQCTPKDQESIECLFDLLESCLKIDPTKRIPTDEILKHPWLI